MSSETFTYKGISAGKYVEGDIEALNQEEASFKLKEQKIIITNLTRSKKKKAVKEKKKGGRKKKTRKKSTKKIHLTITDYKKILTFYKLSIPKTYKRIKKKAEKIISKKFCSCIKKVQEK